MNGRVRNERILSHPGLDTVEFCYAYYLTNTYNGARSEVDEGAMETFNYTGGG